MTPAVALATAFIALAQLVQPASAAAIEAIEVRLFLGHSGELSEPVAEGALLWNTIIGGGDAREPSTSTLVKISVTGAPKSYDARAKVLLTVENRRTKTRRVLSKSLGTFNLEGRQFVAFWLAETGCEELQLEAAATGSNAKVKRSIPFRCGE